MEGWQKRHKSGKRKTPRDVTPADGEARSVLATERRAYNDKGEMLWLYRLLFVPALFVLAPRYLLRMKRRGGYRENFAHRFGLHARLPPPAPGRPRVWLQAVSVGEMLAIQPILDALHREGVEVYLTTTTSTGYRVAVERYRSFTAGIGYFPIDWWPFAQRAWNRIRPDLVVLTEGERWPEHLHQAARHGAPVLSINARMSDRSFGRLRRVPAVARLMLGGVTRLLPAAAADEARFLELGIERAKVTTTGNIKLDVQIPALSAAENVDLRRTLGVRDGLILLGASTWPDEESALCDALRTARGAGLRCSVVIVPRHAERRGAIERVLQDAGWRYHFRSRGPAPAPIDVSVADTTGELRKLLQIADVVFVGKSLPPNTEGQTPVEAAALGKAIVFGPGMSNFRAIADDLVARGAAVIVPDAVALARTATELMQDSPRREQLAAAATAWHRDNAGAVQRTLDIIRAELAHVARLHGADTMSLRRASR